MKAWAISITARSAEEGGLLGKVNPASAEVGGEVEVEVEGFCARPVAVAAVAVAVAVKAAAAPALELTFVFACELALGLIFFFGAGELCAWDEVKFSWRAG